MKKTILKIEASILVAVIICCIFNITAFSQQCDNIRNKMLRMHVVANSNTDADQELKLKVRDAILLEGEKIFDGSVTANEAKEKITPHIERLTQCAEKIITENGYDYPVKISVEKEFFKARTYDNSVTLPSGYYTAIKVIIGEGAGENWWCVMFPPMCLPAAEGECEIEDFLTDEETEIVTKPSKYKFKFKIVEIFETLLNNK